MFDFFPHHHHFVVEVVDGLVWHFRNIIDKIWCRISLGASDRWKAWAGWRAPSRNSTMNRTAAERSNNARTLKPGGSIGRWAEVRRAQCTIVFFYSLFPDCCQFAAGRDGLATTEFLSVCVSLYDRIRQTPIIFSSQCQVRAIQSPAETKDHFQEGIQLITMEIEKGRRHLYCTVKSLKTFAPSLYVVKQ